MSDHTIVFTAGFCPGEPPPPAAERMPASPLLANSVPSSGYPALHTTLPVGAKAANLAQRPSPASRSTRRTRCSGTLSVAAEFLSFIREMSGHMFGMINQIQHQAQIQYDQNQNQTNQILAQAEMQRVSAEKREEAQRAEALKREEMLIQAKMNADQLNADREKCQIEANQKMRADTEAANQKREQALLKLKMDSDETTRKREHLFLENELKRQKLLLDANTALNQEKIKADTTKELASLEALERRELEFQQLQEREKERAIEAQQKLREIATLELKERVHLERELAKQQQQNIILQKQNEIDRLNAEADKKLFQQRFENAEKFAALQREKEFMKEKEIQTEKQMGTSPSTDVVSQSEMVVAESSDSDSPPSPSQPKRRVVRRIVDNTEHLVVVQELPTTDVMCTSSQHIGLSQVTGPCVCMATGKVPVVTQAPAYACPADLGYQTGRPRPKASYPHWGNPSCTSGPQPENKFGFAG